MNLRWLVKITQHNQWNDRKDGYETHESKQEPILQYLDKDGNWKRIPTVEIKRTR